MSYRVISEREVWLAASAMVRRYGRTAALEARRADDALERSDSVGNATWQSIMAAILRWQAAEPEPGETVQ